jgi:hypothetical protein
MEICSCFEKLSMTKPECLPDTRVYNALLSGDFHNAFAYFVADLIIQTVEYISVYQRT